MPLAPPPVPGPPPLPPRYAASPQVQYAPAPSIPLGGQRVVGPISAYPTAPPVYGAPTATILTVESQTVATPARWGAGVAIIAAAGLAASTFLPWVRVDVEGLGLRAGNGWSNVTGGTSWGPLLLILALIAAVTAAPAVVNVRSAAAGVVGLGAAVSAFILAALQLLDVVRTHPGVDATLGYGVVSLVITSAVTMFALAVVALAGRPAKVTGPRAVGAVG